MNWSDLGVLVAGWLIGILTPILTHQLLVWLRGPKLSLTLDPTLTPARCGDDPTLLFFARIRVTNTKCRIAKDCRAYLSVIEKWNDDENSFTMTNYRDCLPLIWAYDQQTPTVDLPNGVDRHIDVVMYAPETPASTLQLYSSSHEHFVPSQYEHLLDNYGVFRFTVLVCADDITPERIRFKVEWDGEWPPEAEIA